jgi:hypothetical protein
MKTKIFVLFLVILFTMSLFANSLTLINSQVILENVDTSSSAPEVLSTGEFNTTSLPFTTNVALNKKIDQFISDTNTLNDSYNALDLRVDVTCTLSTSINNETCDLYAKNYDESFVDIAEANVDIERSVLKAPSFNSTMALNNIGRNIISAGALKIPSFNEENLTCCVGNERNNIANNAKLNRNECLSC